MPDRGTARTRDGRFFLAAAGIVVVALWLRFHRLGLYEIWLDEAFSFEVAATANLREALLRENNPPLYYALQWLWLHLFGVSEVALRSLAAVFGTLFVAAVIAAGRCFLGPATGLWAGAISALAPLCVYYSQEARAYTLLVLTLLLSYLALWRALQVESKLAWATLSGCTLLALATHYMAILALAPAVVLVWIWPGEAGRMGRCRRYFAASALGAAPCLGWVVWSFWIHPHPVGGHSWIQRIWANTPPSQAIPKSLEVLLLGSQVGLVPGFFKQFTLLVFPPALRALGVALLVGLGAFALSPWGDRRMEIPWLSKRKLWLCISIFLPLLTLWGVSFFHPYYVVGRYDLVVFPGYVLLLGLAFAKLQRIGRGGPIAAAGVAVLLLGVLAGKLVLYYEASGHALQPSARGTARALDAEVRNGDLVVFTPGRGMSVYYYLRRMGYERHREACENPETGRRFLCVSLAFDDDTIGLDFDHMSRTSYSSDVLRSDVRALLGRLDPARNAVWVEKRVGPSEWLAVDQMISREAAQAGFRRSEPRPALRGLRMWVHVGADSRR